jgi:hypothetical protein
LPWRIRPTSGDRDSANIGRLAISSIILS